MSRTTRVHPLPGSANRIERSLHPPSWIVLLGGIATTVAVMLIVSRILTANAFAPLFSGGPRAQISQTAFDYGDVKNNTRVETAFTIQNVGDRQLYFRQEPVVTVLAGCCPPTATIDRTELDPGESAKVSLSFSMHEGMDGPHDFRVKVRTNDAVEPEQEVVVLSNWVP